MSEAAGQRSEGGYVRIYRRIYRNPIFRSKLHASIFAYLVAEAAWQPRTVRFNDRSVAVQRGQIMVGERRLAEDFEVSRKVIRGLIEVLEGAQMIDRVGAHGGSLITICNYDRYQPLNVSEGPAEGPAKAPRRAHAGPTQGPPLKEEKESKEGEEQESETLPGFSVTGGPSLIDRMLAIYTEEAPDFVQPRGIVKPTEARGKQMLARLRQDLAGDLEQWRAFCRRCARNRFINGTKTDWKGGRTLDWITNATNFRKIVEGQYAADDGAASGSVISYAEEAEARGRLLRDRLLKGEFHAKAAASN